MRLPGYLAVCGTEVANDLRTKAYLECQGWDFPLDCDCDVYDGGPYHTVATDPAPWYVSTDVRSTEFFGFMLDDVRVLSPFDRAITGRVSKGASLGQLQYSERTLQISGIMAAETGRGMAFGRAWLDEVLRGLCILDDISDVCFAYYCETGGLRMIRQAGLVDGPNYTSIDDRQNDWENIRVGFQISSQLPYLYQEPTVVRNAVVLASGGGTLSNLITTAEWPDDRALEIILEAGATDATNIRITGTVSLDGTCPETRVPPCIDMTIATLPANGRLTIDATKGQVLYRDPISLQIGSGMSLVTWQHGSFAWPEVPPCTSLCIKVSNAGAQNVTYTLKSYPREV